MISNEGTLSDHKSCHKSCHGLGFHSPNRYESDLSNEVLYVLLGLEAAKLSEVKIGGRKKSAKLAGPGRFSLKSGLSRQFLIDLQL